MKKLLAAVVTTLGLATQAHAQFNPDQNFYNNDSLKQYWIDARGTNAGVTEIYLEGSLLWRNNGMFGPAEVYNYYQCGNVIKGACGYGEFYWNVNNLIYHWQPIARSTNSAMFLYVDNVLVWQASGFGPAEAHYYHACKGGIRTGC